MGLGMKGREGEDDSMRCERSNGSDINKDSETGREEVRGWGRREEEQEEEERRCGGCSGFKEKVEEDSMAVRRHEGIQVEEHPI